MIGLNMLEEMEQMVKEVQVNLKVAWDQQNNLFDWKWSFLEF